MSNILFFDTETNGTPNKGPLDGEKQPCIIQLGCLLMDFDGNELDSIDTLVQPGNTYMNKFAFAAHGISLERANADGISQCEAFSDFYHLAMEAEILCCHNYDFDAKMLEITSHKVKDCYDDPEESSMRWAEISEIPYYCTMKSTIQFCQLPFPSGKKGFKYPKLQELHHKLFGEYFADAHDAMEDIKATARCYFELKKLGIM